MLIFLVKKCQFQAYNIWFRKYDINCQTCQFWTIKLRYQLLELEHHKTRQQEQLIDVRNIKETWQE
jgi:hypothetical protein